MSLSRDSQAQRAPAIHAALGAPRGVLRRAACASAVVAAVCLLRVPAAQAEPELPRTAVRLEYVRGSGAERCPDEASLRAEAARRLGYDPFRDDASLVITALIAREESELIARLSLRDAEGRTRWADGFGTIGGCEELAAGMALTIVAGIQSAPWTVPPPEPPPAPAVLPPRAARAAPAPARPAAPRPSHPRREKASASPEPLQIEAGLGAVVGLGMTPGAAAGMTLAAGVRRGDWSIALEGTGLASLGPAVTDASVDISAFTTAAVLCHRRRLLFGCGLAEVGALQFASDAPWDISLRNNALFRLGARFGGDLPLAERLSLRGYAEVIWIADGAVLRRRDYGNPPREPVFWSSPPFGAALGIGLTATY